MNAGFPELLRAYRLYQKMMRYPELIGEMRSIFLAVLKERGIADKAALMEEAKKALEANGAAGEPIDASAAEAYADALVDLYFAKHLTDGEIENYINLARKKERFRELYKVVNREDATFQKIKKALKNFCAIPEGDVYLSPNEAEGVRVALIDYFISSQLPVIRTAKRHVTIRDVDELLDHAYWNRRFPGKIGGKAAGMVVAYKILVPRLAERDPELERYVRIPESYYFNSGVFMDFIEYNNLQQFHSQKYKTREEIEEDYKHLSNLFRKSSFPPDVEKDFREFLARVGQHPLILRSSSLLEDNLGHAFSGKYDSVFLANQGDPETRLREFVWGLNRVHMSTYGPSPILYRRDHNLLDFDEKMSVLVQKVVGRRMGDYFCPFAAGVAFSYSSYNWTPRIRREDGVVRLVMGLGTRAVDRVGSDYPRMIPLSHPTLRSEVDAQQIRKYSQKMMDALDLRTGKVESLPYGALAGRMPREEAAQALSVQQEEHLAPPMFKTQKIDMAATCITFDGFIRNSPFAPLMKKVLRKLEEAYGYPVDVEFAWHEGKLYLLQCRSLTISREEGNVSVPARIPSGDILFENSQVLTSGVLRDIEYAVYVDPKAYARIDSLEGKLEIGRAVSRVNRLLDGKRYALFGPGRWGSNDINLGVKVAYEDINHALVLGEIAFEEGGSTPEVSYGTHFFNDLVEARIIPVALFPDRKDNLLREDFLVHAENEIRSMLPEYAPWEHVIHVVHIPRSFQGRFLQVYQDGRGQKGIGFLDHPSDENSRTASVSATM